MKTWWRCSSVSGSVASGHGSEQCSDIASRLTTSLAMGCVCKVGECADSSESSEFSSESFVNSLSESLVTSSWC